MPAIPHHHFLVCLFLPFFSLHPPNPPASRQQSDPSHLSLLSQLSLTLLTSEHMCVHAFGTMWSREELKRRGGRSLVTTCCQSTRMLPLQSDETWSCCMPTPPSCPSPIGLALSLSRHFPPLAQTAWLHLAPLSLLPVHARLACCDTSLQPFFSPRPPSHAPLLIVLHADPQQLRHLRHDHAGRPTLHVGGYNCREMDEETPTTPPMHGQATPRALLHTRDRATPREFCRIAGGCDWTRPCTPGRASPTHARVQMVALSLRHVASPPIAPNQLLPPALFPSPDQEYIWYWLVIL
jgi:hypothetical protein